MRPQTARILRELRDRFGGLESGVGAPFFASPRQRRLEAQSFGDFRQRPPLEVHDAVFTFVLSLAEVKKLLKGQSVAVDSMFIETGAAMKSIVRRDTGDDRKAYVLKIMAEEDIEEPTDEAIRKFDKKRKKKVLNEDRDVAD